MSKEQWGNATWFLVHTLSEKLAYDNHDDVKELLNHLYNICTNLPCPDCSIHATELFSTANLHLITNKEQLVSFFHLLHERVNQKLNKQGLTLQECKDKYKTAVTGAIVNHYFAVLSSIQYGERTMMNSFHRTITIDEFANYLRVNQYKFLS